MQLLPEPEQLPPLGSQENEMDPVVWMKFYLPGSSWEWYVIEGSPDGSDFRFFGYKRGPNSKWCHFSLSQLEQTRGPLGQRIERAHHFEPGPFHDLVPPPED